jgi:hypothetical protein
MTNESGVWVYAVTTDVDLDLPGATGVADQAVRTVDAAGLAAVVSSVDLAEYGEEALREKLEDLPTLETMARAHHDVVTAAWSRTPVVPMRLATVYRDDARVVAMLAERSADLTAALRQLTGHAEWGVKVYAVAAATPPSEPSPPTGGPARPGTEYLLRRRAELSTAEESRRAAVSASDSVQAELSRLADAVRRHAPQDPQLTGEADPMVLNGAYLVADDRAAEFVDAVRTLDQRHPQVRLELSGPWPGYSFAGAAQEGGQS